MNVAYDLELNGLDEVKDLLSIVSNNLNMKEEEAPRRSITILV